jgi:methylated-DNA-[protein]-cysteine S-methyltransferase
VTTLEDDIAGGLTQALAKLAPGPVDLMSRVFAQWCRVDSAIGEVFLASTDRGVCYLRTGDSVDHDEQRFLELLRKCQGKPARYNPRLPAGVLPALHSGRVGSLLFDLRLLSDFDRRVLNATARIPVGETRPYSWVAEQIAQPKAVRAVGLALGRNPVPLLIPCHRVTRANGDIGGYVFGGEVKERLLRLENVNVDEVRSLAADQIFFLGSDTTNIVCFPTCHHARRITMAHRRGFRSIDQAHRAGYRQCKHCRPGALVT